MIKTLTAEQKKRLNEKALKAIEDHLIEDRPTAQQLIIEVLENK